MTVQDDYETWEAEDPFYFMFGDDGTRATHLRAHWVTPQMPPIWGVVEQQVGEQLVMVHDEKYQGPFVLAVVLKAPHMESKEHVFQLRPYGAAHRSVTRRDDLAFRLLDD